MNKELRVFENEEFGKVRVVEIDNKPWFVGKDVAEILGYSEPRSAVSKKVEEEDRGVAKMETPSGIQKMTIINESGLYSLILSSKLPSAKKFKRWVTDIILPSIRQNGGYIIGQETDSEEEFLAKALIFAQNVIKRKEEKIVELTPKAEYFDALVDRNLLLNFRNTAKEFKVKERFFVKWLEDNKYIYRNSKGSIEPYAQYITGERKYFEIKEFSSEKFSGKQTLITPIGREAFRLLMNV